jgi:thiamine-phosphate pyrophosphorylase
MELIVISNPDAVANESIIINNLFNAGLKYFHIRKPNSRIKAIQELISEVSPQFYNRISLHQFHEIAADFGIKGLHYTEQARKQSNVTKWQALADLGYRLSTSIHDIAMLPTLKHFDYVFYGPVYNSISKPGYQSSVPANFKLNKDAIKPKVIALGGIEESNLQTIKVMNFDGAAVLGTLWNEPDNAINSFNKLIENLRKYND